MRTPIAAGCSHIGKESVDVHFPLTMHKSTLNRVKKNMAYNLRFSVDFAGMMCYDYLYNCVK